MGNCNGYQCDYCGKMHGTDTKGIIVIDELSVTSKVWWMGFRSQKQNLSFCNKDCLKMWVDENI